jgi:hypothetical protein
MTHGTTIFIPKEVICPNCQLQDFDKKVIQEIRGTDTYACVRLKCTHCNYVCSSSPFRIIEPFNAVEEEEND